MRCYLKFLNTVCNKLQRRNGVTMKQIEFKFYGQSHGEQYGGEIYNLPTGLAIDVEAVDFELARRKTGVGRSNRQTDDTPDKVEFFGLVDGKTTNGCLEFVVKNSKVEKREQITALRSGHIDLVGATKHNTKDLRSLNEVASGRNSLCYCVVGAIAKQLLKQKGIETKSNVLEIANCCDKSKFEEIIETAKQNGDSVGGVVEVVVSGLKLGELGDFFPYDKRLDGIIAGALMSIPAVKGVEFGSTIVESGKTNFDKLAVVDDKIVYATNKAGGIVAGITNGCDIVVKLLVKPVPTVKDVETIDFETLSSTTAHFERADSCIVETIGVVAESLLAITIYNQLAEK